MIIAKEYQDKALLIYKGVFTVNLISILGNHLRSLPNHDPRHLQKIFRIFVEISQNVSYYSEETVPAKEGMQSGVGWVTVQEYDDYYAVTTGNAIKPEHVSKLEKYCNQINSLDGEELRMLKRETRSEAMIRETGAQVGLIQISILSSNKLLFTFADIGQTGKYFTLSTRLNK